VLKRVQEALGVGSLPPPQPQVPARGVVPLGRGARGLKGVVSAVGVGHRPAGGLDGGELERRLLEIGFVEGARVEILHEGALGGDPIAVKLDDMRVALRRREADAVLVDVEAGRLRGRRAGRAA
jgi:ferrous iron transport protein A